MLSKNEATPLVTLNLLYFVIFLSICIESDKLVVYNVNDIEKSSNNEQLNHIIFHKYSFACRWLRKVNCNNDYMKLLMHNFGRHLTIKCYYIVEAVGLAFAFEV